MNFAKLVTQLLDRAQNPEQRFTALRFAFQFLDEAASLEQLFIADIDRHKIQRVIVVAQKAAYRHAENAGARCQHAAGTAPAPFDEVFDGKAARQHQMQVFVKYRRIERVALEAAAQEKGTAAS